MNTPGLEFLTVVTRPLRALMAQYRERLREASFQSFSRHLRKLHDGYRAALLPFPPGAERARAMHKLLNVELAAAAHLAHNCSKGCGACCHLEVQISRDEGDLLAALVVQGHTIDRKRLAAQAARADEGPEWALRQVPENRCVFLGDDQACTIYENRPGVCRKVVVTTPAEFCSDASRNPEPILMPLAELILSTALSLPDNPYGSIAKSLHRGLERYEALRDRSHAMREVPNDLDGVALEPATAPRPIVSSRD